MTVNDMTTRADAALRVAVLKVLKDFLDEEYGHAKAYVSNLLNRGERLVAVSPLDGRRLATIPKADPKSVPTVTDMAALTDWMVAQHPGLVMDGYEVGGAEHELIDVLFEHAPHLLTKVRRIRPEVLAELRRVSEVIGEPVGPAGETDIPGVDMVSKTPYVTCTPTSDALSVVKDLYAKGIVQLDGRLSPTAELPPAVGA